MGIISISMILCHIVIIVIIAIIVFCEYAAKPEPEHELITEFRKMVIKLEAENEANNA